MLLRFEDLLLLFTCGAGVAGVTGFGLGNGPVD